MHTERLLHRIRIPRLALIAQAVFLLERGQTDRQTDRQTDAAERPIHAGVDRASSSSQWTIVTIV